MRWGGRFFVPFVLGDNHSRSGGPQDPGTGTVERSDHYRRRIALAKQSFKGRGMPGRIVPDSRNGKDPLLTSILWKDALDWKLDNSINMHTLCCRVVPIGH